MTDEEHQRDEERRNLYNQSRNELLKRQLSNSQILDKSILSLSTAGLGFSVAFIKNVVSLTPATSLRLLHLSWLMFILAIICTLVSFLTSQESIKKELKRIYKYYLHKKEEAFNEKNLPAQITGWLSLASVILYIAAISLTAGFIALNLNTTKEYVIMENKKTPPREVPLPEDTPSPNNHITPTDLPPPEPKPEGAPLPDIPPMPPKLDPSEVEPTIRNPRLNPRPQLNPQINRH